MLPKGHRRTLEHAIGDLQIRLARGVEHKDATDIAGVTPDDKRRQTMALGNPGTQGIAVIANVVEDKAVALNFTPMQRQKVDEERLSVVEARPGTRTGGLRLG